MYIFKVHYFCTYYWLDLLHQYKAVVFETWNGGANLRILNSFCQIFLITLLFKKLIETTKHSVVAAQRKRSLRGCNTSPGGTIGARAEVAGVEVASCLLEDRGPKPPPLTLYPPLWSRLPSLPQGDANATCFCFYVPCTGCMMEPVREFWISKSCYDDVLNFGIAFALRMLAV